MIIIGTGVMGVYLVAAAFSDIKTGYIQRWFLALGVVPSIILRIGMGSLSFTDTIGGIAVGLFFLATSMFSGGKLGKADGIILMYLGAALGFSCAAGLALIAFLLSAVIMAVLLMLKKIAFKSSIPFIPFLLAAYTIVMFYVFKQ
ncbi:MAG: hypothetical protein K6E95_04980 [Lachnospiraceae bacterium]|nr:hypothetical protein [Lachnospiraceae bacterium]